MSDVRQSPPRDAIRNRLKIIDAAKAVLIAHGFGADMRTIAKEAGVGIGTLYRHFPSREHLIEEFLDPDLADLILIRIIQLTRGASPNRWEHHVDLVLAGLSSAEHPVR